MIAKQQSKSSKSFYVLFVFAFDLHLTIMYGTRKVFINEFSKGLHMHDAYYVMSVTVANQLQFILCCLLN